MMAKNNLSILIRIFSYSILALTFVFLVNNILTVWFDWPGVKKLFAHYELFGFKKLNKPLEGLANKFIIYSITILLCISHRSYIFCFEVHKTNITERF